MSYANDMPTVEMASRTDAGLASELRLSVMRLRRRLAGERHPDKVLSMGAWAVLGCLFRNGDLTVGDLAAQERIQPPSMTRIVNGLEHGGYVVRRAHETAGRHVVGLLSEGGRATGLGDRAPRDRAPPRAPCGPRRRAGPPSRPPLPAATPGSPSACAGSAPTSATPSGAP